MENDLRNSLDDFRKIMSDINRSLEQLTSTEDRKYEALKVVDVKTLMKLNADEEDLIQIAAELEKRRSLIVRHLAKQYGFDPMATLSEIVTYLPLEVQESFAEIRKSIKTNTNKLALTLRENETLVRTNLDIVNFTMSVINKDCQRETYDYRNQKSARENIGMVNKLA